MKKFLLDGMEIDDVLLSLAATGNRKFSQTLHPGIDNVLGLRLPDMRSLARRIAMCDNIDDYLADPGDAYMESRMLHGLVLGQVIIAATDAYLAKVDKFVRTICSWSVCDSFDFSGKKKFVNANRQAVYDFLVSWLDSPHEYEVRFGVVMLMKHYLDSESVRSFLRLMEGIVHPGYYVRMAVAWAVSVACVTNPDVTLSWLEERRIDATTHSMAIRKIVESLRISDSDKTRARSASFFNQK